MITELGISTPLKLIRIKEVVERTAMSRESIYIRLRKGEFPKQVKLSRRSVRFVESEIEAFIQQMMDTRTD